MTWCPPDLSVDDTGKGIHSEKKGNVDSDQSHNDLQVDRLLLVI
jgi:hypothetical protein